MTTYRHNKTKVILLAILIILWGAIGIQRASGGTYTDSIHGGGWSGKGIPGVNRSTIDSRYSNYATGNCAHCHEKHASLGGSEPAPSPGGPHDALLFSEEEAFCEECHDGDPVLPDVKTQAGRYHRHPINDISNKHIFSKLEWGQGGTPFRGANRHSECCDCHNPHTIGGIDTNTPKLRPRGTTPNRDANGNLIYHASFGTAALQGVWGVEPVSWPSEWQSPTSFTETLPSNGYPRYAEKEYQICFKCHSYYALGTSDGDMAREFNPNNKSGHPVVAAKTGFTGLTAIQLYAPWKTAHSTMYCSDCHGGDGEGVTQPQGVHGSNPIYPYHVNAMLRSFNGGNHHYWPWSPLGSGWYWNLDQVRLDQDSWNEALFCRNCHPIKQFGTTDVWANSVHSFHSTLGGPMSECLNCHVQRVHGSQSFRFIGGMVTQFSGSLGMDDCYAPGCGYHETPIE